MSEVPFHSTRMGQRFFEHTMPELVRQLQRLNENLERAFVSQASGDAEPDGGPDLPAEKPGESR